MKRRLAVAITCAVAVGLLGTGSASAKTFDTYADSGFFFDGSGSTAGPFTGTVSRIAFSESDQTILVLDEGNGMLSKFDAATGNAVDFSALGVSSFEVNSGFDLGSRPDVAVDNTGLATDGNIYVTANPATSGRIFSYTADGTLRGGFPLSGNANPSGIAVDPEGNLWISEGNAGRIVRQFTPNGIVTGKTISHQAPLSLDTDSLGNIYVSQSGRAQKYNPSSVFQYSMPEISPAVQDIAVDRSDDSVFLIASAGATSQVHHVDANGSLNSMFVAAPSTQDGRGITVDPATHDVYVSSRRDYGSGQRRVIKFSPSGQQTIPTVTTAAADFTGNSATLRGVVDPDGISPDFDTDLCRFEWGPLPNFNNNAPCAEGQVFTGPGANPVSAEITGLTKGTRYQFRLTARNADNNVISRAVDFTVLPQELPIVDGSSEVVAAVSTESALIEAQINPNGGFSNFRVEVGTEPGNYTMSFPPLGPGAEVGNGPNRNRQTVTVEQAISDLQPDTTYHFRVVGVNEAGEGVSGEDHVFRTYPLSAVDESCPNNQARQQTSSAQLADCRAYELVSASNTGGYDVRSDLAAGVQPLPGYPEADDEVLYSMRSGTIPGIPGNPTNRGADPYVATRGENGWSTRYVGLPANNPFAGGPFASPLTLADAALDTFAFGGPDICDPCWEDGSTNVPVRLPDGRLVKGMRGSLDPGAVESEGDIRKSLSKDGSHFLFGSKAKLENDANDSGTDLTIYKHDLETGATQVVSKLPSGDTIEAGDDVIALDISEDGSRTVIGEWISTDSEGNDYVHPYMHVGNSPNTIDLTPGTTSGVIYNGMTDDGTMVFFASPDQLTGDDNDTSIDVFRAEADGSSADLERVSIGAGGTGDTDACDPAANSQYGHWNSVDGTADCSALPIAGGGGIASDSGAIHFLSPEDLDGGGTEDAPNLYLAEPGEDPSYVATLESVLSAPQPLSTEHSFSHTFAGVTDPGAVAVDRTTGSVYVASHGTGSLLKFDANGNPSNFTATATSSITGFNFSVNNAQVAVDNSGGPGDGNIYVANNITTAQGTVRIFNRAGTMIGELNGSGTPQGQFGTGATTQRFPTSVAVAPNGDLYVGGLSGKIHRFVPSGNPVVDADYQATLNFAAAATAPTRMAVDSGGTVYVHSAAANGVRKYAPSQFGVTTPTFTTLDTGSQSVAVNPANDLVVVARSANPLFREYTSAGVLRDELGTVVLLTSYRGIAFNATNGRIYISADAAISADGVSVWDTQVAPDPRVDSPLVIHAVNEAESRDRVDFEVTPDGSFSVFSSTNPLTGYPNLGHSMVFRHHAATGDLDCVACPPTKVSPSSDTKLSPHGLNLADDGRVFFTSAEQLTLRDGNKRKDAYQWSDGQHQLVSTGNSPTDSTLLTASADGVNAFFFTRQTLVPSDKNGNQVKLYTARENGGFPFGPPEFQCAAKDECHGPSSAVASPAQLGSYSGTPGQFREPTAQCNLSRLSRNAKQALQRAKSLRRQASRASGKRGRLLRGKAANAARSAKQASNAATKCRRARASGGSSR